MKHSRTVLWISLLAFALTALPTTSADADVRRHRTSRKARKSERGFSQGGVQLYLGLGGQGYEIEDNDYAYLDELESQGLFFLGATVGLNPRLALYVEGAGSEHETLLGDMTFGYVHLGLKYAPNVGPRHRWQPYGKASIGAIFLVDDHGRHHFHDHDDFDNGYVGPSVGLAAGVDHWIGRRTALFGEVGLMMGEFDEQVIDGHEHDLRDNIGISSARLAFGLRFRL